MTAFKSLLVAAVVWLGVASLAIGGTISIPFPGPGGAAPPPSISFQGSTSSGTDGTVFSFATQPFGTAASSRVIAICVSAITIATGSTTFTTTIGGISATTLAYQLAAASSGQSAIQSAAVPTGTTGTISVTVGTSARRLSVGIWSIYNTSTQPTTANSSSATANLNMNVNAGDVGVVCGFNNATPPTYTATAGFTADYDINIGAENSEGAGGSFTAATAATPRTVTATWTGASNNTSNAATFR